jgi:hypothetical protein
MFKLLNGTLILVNRNFNHYPTAHGTSPDSSPPRGERRQRPFPGKRLVRIRTAPHAGRPELARPKSLEFTYWNRAIGMGVSVVLPIGAVSLGVTPVLCPRRCIGLSEPAARNKRKHDDANQSGGVAHLQSYASGADSPTNSVVIRSGRSRATLGWISRASPYVPAAFGWGRHVRYGVKSRHRVTSASCPLFR